MKVAFDGVVFTQSRAGSARAARGLLHALPAVAPDVGIVPIGLGAFAGRGSVRQKLAAVRQDVALVRRGPRPGCATCGSGRVALPDVPRAAAQTGAAGGRDRPRSRRPARAGVVPGVEPQLRPPPHAARDPARRSGRVRVARDRARRVRSARRPRVPGARGPQRDRRAVLGAGGRRRRRRPLHPVRRNARASQEPRTARRGDHAARRRGPPRASRARGSRRLGRLSSFPARARIIRLGRVDDATLRDLYAHARCVAYPSLWEGFGLVAGEALATGCPVVCSDIPALREVAGADAVYCDPGSVESIADALAHARSTERGPRRAARSRGRPRRDRSSRCGGSSPREHAEARARRRRHRRQGTDGRRGVHDQPAARAALRGAGHHVRG